MAKTSIVKLNVPGSSAKVKVTRIIRFAYYLFIFLLLARGVISFFNSGSTVVQNLETPTVVTDRAQSYAQAFAKAYYTVDPENKNVYRETMQTFVGSGLVVENAGMVADSIEQKLTVISTLPWQATQKAANTADIDVRVEIEQQSAIEGQQGQRFFRMLRVPIAYDNNQFYVNDFPTVLPAELAITGDVLSLPELNEADKGVKEQVKLALDDFFRSFSIDPPSKLKYFVADGKEIRGYEGSMIFTEIKDVRVYLPSDVSQTTIIENVTVYTTTSWADAQGFEQVQHHTFDLTFKDERWYVKTFQGGFKQ